MIDEIFEYAVYVAFLIACALPLSAYINKVMAGEKHFLSCVTVPVERCACRIMGIDSCEQMGWRKYLASALIFSIVSFVVLMAVLMLQGFLPLNPEGLSGLSGDLAFNTAASFVSNTNWQSYSGESTLSYFSQAIGLTVQNFVTPAVGMAVLFALFRGLVAQNSEGLGSFWTDVVRALLGVLIPLSLVLAVADVWQGSPQNMSDYQTTQLVEPVGIAENGEVVSADDPSAVEAVDEMVVPMGPQASQVAIKQLGTNGQAAITE